MTDTKVYTPDLGNTEMEMGEHMTLPPVSLEILQALVRLMAFDKQNNTFRFLKSDELGNLRVTLGQPGIFLSTSSQFTATTTPQIAIAEQPSRKQLIIRNFGFVRLFYRYTDNLNLFGSMYLEPGDVLEETLYTGAVSLQASVQTCPVQIMQLTSQFVN